MLSRWSVKGCANCQTHLEAKAFVGLDAVQDEELGSNAFDVEIRTRDGVLIEPPPEAPAAAGLAGAAAPRKRLYRIEVR